MKCPSCHEYPRDCPCAICDYCETLAPVNEEGWCEACANADYYTTCTNCEEMSILIVNDSAPELCDKCEAQNGGRQ